MEPYYYDESMLQLIIGVYAVLLVVLLVVALISIIALWRIFTKANIGGWKSIIPIYNVICLFKITWGSGWVFLACFVPVVNVIIGIITLHKLAQVFGKGIGFTIGLILLQPIFILILAFGSAEYNAIESI
jgi:Na+/H+-translocating membrane pyrophosphatase